MPEGLEELLAHGVRCLFTVDAGEDAEALVVIDEGDGLLFVDVEPVGDCFGVVIATLLEGGAAAVALSGGVGRVVGLVVDGAVGGAGPAAAEAGDDFLGADVDKEDVVDLLATCCEDVVEGVGLGDGAGKAIEQTAGGGVGLVEAVEQHADGDVVGDEGAFVDVGLGGTAEVGPTTQVVAKHVAAGDVGESGGVGQVLSLGPFAGAGGSEQDAVHA